MFDRLLLLARLASWAFTGLTIVYIASDVNDVTLPHEGAIWAITAISWALFMELKSRTAMRDQIIANMGRRMDDYEIHTLGHTLATERTIGCQPGSPDN